MNPHLLYRMVREPSPRILWNFATRFGWNGLRAVQKFERRRKNGEPLFPAFVFISLNESCNLRCQGCWVTTTNGANSRQLALADVHRVIEAAKANGARFFGLLGGEPLLYPDLISILEQHSDCYFQLFTNGTLLTDDVAARLAKAGNVTPLISVEGLEEVSDERRGGRDVFRRSMAAFDHCRKHRLIFGAATSICKTNLDDLVNEDFVNELAKRGVHYLWYYIYRPVGPRPTPELALSKEEILRLRRFLVDVRGRAPLMVVDAYWNHKGEAMCPAATGISHHVGPGGDIEPCPPIQFARENLRDCADPGRAFSESEFLENFREYSRRTTQGCVLLEDPAGLLEFMKSQQARDSSGRDHAYDELAAMTALPGHHLPGEEIPERDAFYYFAKKHWFFGFGAYG
jgi:MoaA/NifB/PqqE/SkfB family radical SAM enzyme